MDLLVEGEVGDVHGASADVDGGRDPVDVSVVVDDQIAGERHVELAVSTAQQ